MNRTIIVYDPKEVRENLLPITYTRPVGAIRVGISTMAERWQAFLPGDYAWSTEEYLTELYPSVPATADALYVAGNVVATHDIALAVNALHPGQVLVHEDIEIAHCGDVDNYEIVEYRSDIIALKHVYDIFGMTGEVMELDFARITSGRKSRPVNSTNIILGDASRIFLEEGASIDASIINTNHGPVYIGKDATVMEGCRLRGPVALCEHSVANMGTLIYGATTLGPWCKVGGEINNIVMLGYSNKAHDGFLGNAVIGEWCNLGADTVASNLKNDYTEIKLWNYHACRFLKTGLQFCGLIMGDHSKSAIHTSFNTATVVGVGCNIISPGMPRQFIPSFSKGGSAGFENVNLTEFFAIATRMMARRGIELTDAHRRLFHSIYDFADRFK